MNLSPKGYDSFTFSTTHRVAYLDFTGSGAETIAHVRQNGRITFMFCAFNGKANIVRLYGTGTVVTPEDAVRNLAALVRRPGPSDRSSSPTSTARRTRAAIRCRSWTSSPIARRSTRGPTTSPTTSSRSTGPRRTPNRSTAFRPSEPDDPDPPGPFRESLSDESVAQTLEIEGKRGSRSRPDAGCAR